MIKMMILLEFMWNILRRVWRVLSLSFTVIFTYGVTAFLVFSIMLT